MNESTRVLAMVTGIVAILFGIASFSSHPAIYIGIALLCLTIYLVMLHRRVYQYTWRKSLMLSLFLVVGGLSLFPILSWLISR